ncbi:uncharacterized protein [Leuresthes tenuis]|uniref:uncharacterized protein n=1 Tax=Leuresthes tenuis TaxID=355514 RepID=UPI003B514B52
MPRRRSLQPDDPRGLSLVPPIPAASTSELEQTQDSKEFILPADVQKVVVIKEEVPWSSSVDQRDAALVQIKVEEEDSWTSQQEEQLHGPGETDITRLSFTVLTAKSEDEEKPQPSQFHKIKTPSSISAEQMKTETDEEDCEGPEPARNPDPHDHLQSNIDDKTPDSSETEVSDDDYWQKSGPKKEDSYKLSGRMMVLESSVKHDEVSDAAKTSFSSSDCGKQFVNKTSTSVNTEVFCCSVCDKIFSSKENLLKHTRIHTGETTFVCTECGKKFKTNKTLKMHKRIHSREKSFSRDVCGKRSRENEALSSHIRVHTFGCEVCHKVFKRKPHLHRHMRVHTGEKPFGCRVCGNKFSRNEELKKHMRVHPGVFCCTVCDKIFNTQSTLTRHMRIHTEPKPLSCHVCGKTFSGRRTLTKHMRVHRTEKPFSCGVCGKKFRERGIFSRHMKFHAGAYRCTVCDKICTTQGNLVLHQKSHTGEKPFACEVCGKAFKLKTHLQTHMRVHTGEKPFRCDVCGKKFCQQRGLSRHMIVHIEEAPFSCGICGKKFSEQGIFSIHMKFHTGAYCCTVCDKIFTTQGNLVVHQKSHTGEKPFACEECGKAFTLRASLKKHMRVHNGEKPFGCDVCGTRFCMRESFIRHMAVHTGEKPFSCGVCGKKFSERGLFSIHMKFHTGSFCCTVCDKIFTTQGSLSRHTKIHQGEKPFGCHVCGKNFNRNENLKTHMRVHIAEKPQPSQFHKIKSPTCSSAEQKKTETDEEDCEGPEPTRNPDPHGHLQSKIDDKTSDSSGTEDSDDDYRQKSGPKTEDSYKDSGQMMVLKSRVKHVVSDAAKIPFSSSDSGKQFVNKTSTRVNKGAFCCTVCDKIFTTQGSLSRHTKIHTGEKPFGCHVCGKNFNRKCILKFHMRVHTGEKPQPSQFHKIKSPISSSAEQKKTKTDEEDCEGPEPARNPDPHGHLQSKIDDKTSDSSGTEDSDDDYRQKSGPKTEDSYKDSGQMMVLKSRVKHVVSDAAKISFSSSDSGKQFVNKTSTRVNKGAFCCTVCDKIFSTQRTLSRHMKGHTEGKPQPSQFHKFKTPTSSSAEQMKTETDEEDCEGPEPARNPDPHGHLQSNIDDKTSDSSLTVGNSLLIRRAQESTEERFVALFVIF